MKRYVIVGTGHRAYMMFARGIADRLSESCAVVGVYDPNRTRATYYKTANPDMHIYGDFDEMLDTERPDGVIIGTVDSVHHEYAVRAMEKGYDVICEKPLTNTYEGALAISEAQKRTGRQVTVTFNCRFMPVFVKVKELVSEGRIGRVFAVNYNYCLNRWHGGDYFKRWHRKMEFSQGMLLHKSTHHFDIVNWLLEDEPCRVSAMGRRSFYGNPEKSFAKRCSECPRASECESYKSQSAPLDKALYFDAEHEDGYIRDKCAYLPDTDIYDNMSVTVEYCGGTLLTYMLNLFSMREGYTLTLTGERGVIIVDCYRGEECTIRLMNEEGVYQQIPYEDSTGEHGGGDRRLLDMIFADAPVPDPLGQMADSFAGYSSAVIGMAANESIRTGNIVSVTEMLDRLR